MWWKRICLIASLILGIIGLAGVPDDIKRWQEWLKMLDHEIARWLFVIVGFGGFLYLLYRDRMKAPAVVLPREELWKASPGAGRVIARAIMEADTLVEARSLFDAHSASPNPKDTAWAGYALTKRMDAEGEDVMPFIAWLIAEGTDVTDHLEEIEADPIFRDKGRRR